MSQLMDMLQRAFENKGNKNRYSTGPWSIGFDERVFDTRFELYHNGICLLDGNTLDKELIVRNSTEYPLEQLVPEVEKALPEYHFKIQLSMLIPVDLDFYWEKEIEGAEYVGVADEVRYEDLSDGVGYDVAIFSVPRLSDLENVRIEEKDRSVYKIDGYDMRLVNDGAIEVTPTYFAPINQLDLSEQINAAKAQASNYRSADGIDIENER